MKNWTLDDDTMLPKCRCRMFYIDLINRESEVLRRPFPGIFLKHNHAGLAARS